MSRKDNSIIKGLNGTIKESSEMIDILTAKLNEIKHDIQKWETKKAKAESKLKAMTTPSKKLIVSEHAILHYINDVLGLDTNSIVEEIQNNEELIIQYITLGNGEYVVNNIRYIVKNNIITSLRKESNY